MRRIFAVLLVLCLTPSTAWSWGNVGHHITSKLAEREMDPAVLAEVRVLLDGQTLADVCLLPDTWKKTTCKETRDWHFVDIPTTEDEYDADRDCDADGIPENCLLPHLEDYLDTLRNTNASHADRREALIFVVHLVEDLHQPLHSAAKFYAVPTNGSPHEQGGNKLHVNFFGQVVTLHSVWDTGIIRKSGLTESQYVNYLADDVLGDRTVEEIAAGTPVEWVNEAHAIAVDHAYHLPKKKDVNKNPALGRSYYNANGGLLDEQLLRSGLRLRRLIEESLR